LARTKERIYCNGRVHLAISQQNTQKYKRPPHQKNRIMTSPLSPLFSYTNVPVSSDPLFVPTVDANNTTTSCTATGTMSVNHNSTAVLCFDQDDDEKTCRICLQDDNDDDDDEPHDLIAPCRCKGSSKWVHRHCLDQWRAVNRQDIAFSQCTECLFQYHLETDNDDNAATSVTTVQCPKKLSYCLYVSRDLCCILTMIQMVIALLGGVVWLVVFYPSFSSSSNNMNEAGGIINHNDTDTIVPASAALVCTAMDCQIVVSYLGGLCALLVGLGLYGSIVLCAHGCSISNSVNAISDHVFRGTPSGSATRSSSESTCLKANTMNDRETNTTVNGDAYHHHYNHRGSRRRPRRGAPPGGHCCFYTGGDPCCCCSTCPWDCYCPSSSQHSTAAAGSNNDGSCCECCIGGAGAGGGSSSSSSAGDSGSNDGAHILLVILAIVGIVLALIGFILGSIIAIMAIQRILQQHLWILQKQRLVQHFRVRDLSHVMEDDHILLLLEENDRPMEKGALEHQDSFGDRRMMRQRLPEEDVNHLKKLKLLQ
jgi:RING-variant domain